MAGVTCRDLADIFSDFFGWDMVWGGNLGGYKKQGTTAEAKTGAGLLGVS